MTADEARKLSESGDPATIPGRDRILAEVDEAVRYACACRRRSTFHFPHPRPCPDLASAVMTALQDRGFVVKPFVDATGKAGIEISW